MKVFTCAVIILIFIMPINTEELLRVVVDVMSHEDVRVTLTESMKGSILAGVGAAIGALTLGPPGLAIGGLSGALVGWITVKPFKRVYEIIRDDFTADQKAQLATRLRSAFQSAGVDDIVLLTAVAISTPIRGIIVSEVLGFMTNEMNLETADERTQEHPLENVVTL